MCLYSCKNYIYLYTLTFEYTDTLKYEKRRIITKN